jgi:hypothetical protein
MVSEKSTASIYKYFLWCHTPEDGNFQSQPRAPHILNNRVISVRFTLMITVTLLTNGVTNARKVLGIFCMKLIKQIPQELLQLDLSPTLSIRKIMLN